jgi:hypothetical protein
VESLDVTPGIPARLALASGGLRQRFEGRPVSPDEALELGFVHAHRPYVNACQRF